MQCYLDEVSHDWAPRKTTRKKKLILNWLKRNWIIKTFDSMAYILGYKLENKYYMRKIVMFLLLQYYMDSRTSPTDDDIYMSIDIRSC